MRNSFLSFLIASVVAVTLFTSCSKDSTSDDTDVVGNWVRSSDFEGVARGEAVASVASNNKVYAGLGFDGTNRLTDWWEYNVTSDFWLQKTAFPGVARNSAVSFSAGGKVYVGLGYDGLNNLRDFYEYNPADNTWRRIADFAGSARYGSVAFSVNGKGYICGGYDGNYLKDFWEYNPATNEWIQKVSPGGSKRNEASVFVIGNKAYLVGGVNNGSPVNDFWEYDGDLDKWTEKRKISNVSDDTYDDSYNLLRSNAVAFTLNGKGYFTTGINGSYISTTWEYDPATDLWTLKTSYEGSGREGAIGFSVNNHAYVGLGRSSSLRFDDMREWKPADAYDSND